MSCNGLAITEVECSGGPIKIHGVPTFWLSRIIWAVPTCVDVRHGCPVGAKPNKPFKVPIKI